MMDQRSRQSAEALDAVRAALAAHTVETQFERDPTLRERYGPHGERIWRAQASDRLAHLAEAVAVQRPAIFVDNARWCRAALAARDVAAADLDGHFRAMREALAAQLPSDLAAVCTQHVDMASAGSGEPCAQDRLTDRCDRDDTLARLYLLHLLQRNRAEALKIVADAQAGGMSLAGVYERIIMPAMREIGCMWHLQEASVADEHYCTAATQSIMEQVRASAPRKPWNGFRALCCAVGGDLHDLGVRMVNDLFEGAGWHTEFLGASTPTADIVMTLADNEAPGARPFDILSVGASTSLSVRAMADLVDAVRAMPAGRARPILVGGAPFRLVPDLWQVIGADACATSPSDALAKAEGLVQRARPTHPAAGADPRGCT